MQIRIMLKNPEELKGLRGWLSFMGSGITARPITFLGGVWE